MLIARAMLAVPAAAKTDSKRSPGCGRLQAQLALDGFDRIGSTMGHCVVGLLRQRGGTSVVEGGDRGG
jgi:hypothetical protein